MKHLFVFLFIASLSASAQSPFQRVSRSEVPKELRQGSPLQPQQANYLIHTKQNAEITQNATVRLQLPHPSGSWVWAQLTAYAVLSDARKQSDLGMATWLGNIEGDASAVVRADQTPQGFHVQVLSPNGDWYIDPVAPNNAVWHMAYFKSDLPNPHSFECGIQEQEGLIDDPVFDPFSTNPNGGTLRTYRLALAATAEYTNYHGGATGALAAMVTAINRVNGIYERDLAVRMVLIPNTDLLIYTSSVSDPYTNNDGFTMLGENQSNINAVIGAANYDIGHVFSTGGGGIASLASVCTNSKAQGVTGLPNPIGDPFYVDYVAHEIGHQFNGSHTFNSSLGSCSGNRSSQNAYEPGSGSTIMAYAGICEADNVSNNSDDYFHVRSYQTMLTFLQGTGGNCAATTPTGNTPPTVNGQQSPQTVFPIGTPFKLTAAGSDADGDALTYCWEHYNRAGSIALATNPTTGTPPLFVSLPPTNSPTRWFPRLSFVVNNANSVLEKLPTYTRAMTFRVTVRDNKPNGGGVSYTQVAYDATAQAGPFLVTNPNTSQVQWSTDSLVSISWDVANTNQTPVNCSQVNLLLSTDGGYTYPYTLVSAAANDGQETLILPFFPNEPSLITQARVMVESVGNIFYDISNADFIINNTPSSGLSSWKQNLEILPNPSSMGLGTILATALNPEKFSVFYSDGRQVAANLEGNSIRIQDPKPGLYVVQIETAGILRSFRWVIVP
jgi:hypothetical protein